ncbi:imidazole glycerol phosphate synthase subunit HisH [Endozoicomonas numazuensis]|uniref:Imidazole glycerol phosphate synthase subunit HisH n=1 Tax=Endozoicomonas numazuensis TaxID=1137799 RepID=A0A081N3R7_9GAMM|nr:imidazole glycerol phosphate synthase subunit HisH [Endozoicomonas numazuensis]KEQ13090.1 imidazole glycerol phosphate synthase [Endozoicomonas numazuensis]
MSDKIYVVDYQAGNLGSVSNIIRHIGGEPVLVNRPEDLLKADRVILPGVGAFDFGMSALTSNGMNEAVLEVAKTGIPLLGICLGMQLLLNSSDEGKLPGLGLIKGKSNKFKDLSEGMKIPHMGWNTVRGINSVLLKGQEKEQRFYFVHSYFVECDRKSDIAGVSTYSHDFVSMVENENVLGVQFHPEKSHKFGMALLKNFLEM